MKKKMLGMLVLIWVGTALAAYGQSVTVTAPNGGESWTIGERENITWTHSVVSGNVRINLVNAAGGVVGTIATVPVADDRYNWTVGTLASGSAPVGEYLIGLFVASADVDDRSNATFSIVAGGSPPPAPTVTVTSPNGGENWELGSSHPITWDQTNLTGTVNIDLLNGGTVLGRIASGRAASPGSYPWTVGDYSGGRGTVRGGYRVRVQHSSGTPSDDSNRDFSIAQAGTEPEPPPQGGNDLTISKIYLEQRSSGKGIRLRVTDLQGDFNGWVVFSTFTGKMGLGNAVKERRRLELRRGVPAWVNLANLNGSYFRNECSLSYVFQVNPDHEVVETNYDNNRVSMSLFWNSTHDGRVFPVQRIGRNYTEACEACAVVIRPADVESVTGNRVRIRLEITVRNCGNSTIESGTVKVFQTWTYRTTTGREMDGGGQIDSVSVGDMAPGNFRILNRTVTLERQSSSNLSIYFDCGESGSLDSNNHFHFHPNFIGF
ncbi:MAG: GPI anchored serine-threonine rich family protein [Candidatus Aminicenantes bacterium]|nr:GPI anchored serine-threonine rich family protein [Candidatus Aminicenantes bacterium]